MKIVAAFDSFKGSLSSLEAAEAAREGVLRAIPNASFAAAGIADGGEGTLAALAGAEGAPLRALEVCGPLGGSVRAHYAVLKSGVAVIELAQAAGLTLVPEAQRNPLRTTTYGVGELIRGALDRGARRFLIALGGSATNDGGAGMLAALGAKFVGDGGEIARPAGGDLERIQKIDTSGLDPRLAECAFDVACDVDNPLCGARGAAAVYAPQKGAGPDDAAKLDDGLRHFARLAEAATGVRILDAAGAGAAGGTGGGCLAFLKARLRPGIDCVLDAVGFDSLLEGADWALTGEGKIDAQSLRGKAPVGIAKRAAKFGVPVVAFGGSVEVDGSALRAAGIRAAFPIHRRFIDLKTAVRADVARAALADACESVFSLF